MNKPSPDKRPKKAVTLDDLADELFSITTIFRYLFWGPDDYRLEMLRLTLKARVKEAKYSRKSHRPKE